MRTLSKETQSLITPQAAVDLLKAGNQRFLENLRYNRNLLQQVNETREGQHPFAVIVSCMDSRTSAELIFDQGLGDIFSVRIAGNVVNEDTLASAEFGCKVVGAKVILVLGHSACGAIKGAIDDVQLGHLPILTKKIQRCIGHKSQYSAKNEKDVNEVTIKNVALGIEDLRSRSEILREMEIKGEIKIVGAVYDVASGAVEFLDSFDSLQVAKPNFNQPGAWTSPQVAATV